MATYMLGVSVSASGSVTTDDAFRVDVEGASSVTLRLGDPICRVAIEASSRVIASLVRSDLASGRYRR